MPLERDGWGLDLDRIASAIRPETKLVLVNFPNSPTGADLGEDTLNGLVALCREHGLWLLNDEVYRQTAGMGGSAAARSVCDVYERGVSVNGLSKGFGLPGLRVGWAVCRNPYLFDKAVQAKSLMSSCLSSSSEVLAHMALRAAHVITERTRMIGRRNRLRLDTMLRQLPDVFEPALGDNLAFAFPRYLGPESVDVFAERLARDLGPLVLPSTLWRSRLGPTPDDHVRIGLGHARSYAGLEALEQYLSLENADFERKRRLASSG